MAKRKEWEVGTQGLYLTFTKRNRGKGYGTKSRQTWAEQLFNRGLKIRRGRK